MYKHLSLFIISLLFSAGAWAKTCNVEIGATDKMQYTKEEIDVAGDCTEVELTLDHVGKLPKRTMGHSWILAKTSDVKGILNDGIKAGPDNGYTKPNDPRIIAQTGVIAGGESKTIDFPTKDLKKGGDYTYFCAFPGHEPRMHGVFKYGS